MPSFEARVTWVSIPLEGAAHLTQSTPCQAYLALATLALLGLAPPALAMDCQKAASPLEKAICADPAASAADQAMDKAWSPLYGRSSEAEKKQLLQSQRAWLKQRASSCSDDKKPSVKCLIDWTQRRALYLQGKPETGPGTGHDLIPVIVAQTGTKNLYEVDISTSKFSAPVLPGEKLFNTEVDKSLKDAPSKKDGDDRRDMTYSYDLHQRVTYASPQFLSATTETYLFSGGAHGNSETSGINIDIAKGKDAAFADVFDEAAHKKLGDLCFEQIKAQKKEKDMDLNNGLYTVEQLRKTVEDAVGALGRWSFTASQGTVTFDPYELGAYVEGSYECTFATDVLHPLYKAGSILP
jgi:uncharacterized protein YecT (DUF1311 family)